MSDNTDAALIRAALTTAARESAAIDDAVVDLLVKKGTAACVVEDGAVLGAAEFVKQEQRRNPKLFKNWAALDSVDFRDHERAMFDRLAEKARAEANDVPDAANLRKIDGSFLDHDQFMSLERFAFGRATSSDRTVLKTLYRKQLREGIIE